jgi:hypothetical protein
MAPQNEVCGRSVTSIIAHLKLKKLSYHGNESFQVLVSLMRRSVRIEYDAMPEATTCKGSQPEISATNAETTRTAASKEQNFITRS